MKLNQSHRNILFDFAKSVVKGDPALIRVRDRAYDAAFKLVTEGMERKFPPSDMAVLLKYKQAERDDCIRVKHSDELSSFDEFQFVENDGPMLPKAARCGWGSRPVYDLGNKAGAAVIAWSKAVAALDADIKSRLDAYHKVIYGSNRVDQVLAVWPEAKVIADRFQKNPLVAVNDAVIAAIAADSALRAKPGP